MRYLILLLLGLFMSSQVLAEESLQIMTEEFAPYQFYDGDSDNKAVKGISIEIVQAIQEKIDNQDKIKVLPWSRGLKLLNKNKNSFLFSTARTPQRESKYKWVGPLSKLEIVFFKKKGSPISFRSLEEAKTIEKIGVTKNVATHSILADLGFTNLDIMKSGADEKNLARLVKGRVDVWPTAYYAGVYSARKLDLLDQIEVIPNVKLMSGYLYIAVNKDTDDRIIHQWQTALDDLKSEGVIEAIHQNFDR